MYFFKIFLEFLIKVITDLFEVPRAILKLLVSYVSK